MGKVLIFFFILLSASAYSQNPVGLDFETYQAKYMGAKGTYDYISYGNRRGPDSLKRYTYFKSNGKNVLAVFEKEVLIRQTIFDSTNLFEIVKQNMASLKKVMYAYLEFYEHNEPSEKYLAIKFKGLHFNHYGNKSAEFISSLKNKKLQQGFITINLLIELIEKDSIWTYKQ
jgi:hypothetical protein